jgi:hypothetical protein
MAGYGYSYVSDKSFVAFLHDLSEGAWKSVSIAKYDNAERTLSPAMLDAPQPVLWKLRIVWAIAALKDALGSGTLDKLDADWDACQRRLYHQLATHADDKSQEIREAAARLQGLLLQGGGTGQTSLDYDGEVDFGRHQILVTGEGQAAADVKKLKLGEALQDIAKATEALAKGLGRTSGGKRPAAPSARQREALAACTAAFNGVHDTIAWFIEHTPGGPELERLQALMAPFEALLERNPPPAGKGAAAGKGAVFGGAAPPTEGTPG